MANTYVKKQADHPSDYQTYNNGGILIGHFRGATPSGQMDESLTQPPQNNRPILQIDLTSYSGVPFGTA